MFANKYQNFIWKNYFQIILRDKTKCDFESKYI